jgi:predicted phosphodiesterase
MTVSWRTYKVLDPVRMLYRIEGSADAYSEAAGVSETFDESTAWINSVELAGLNPGTRYEVMIPHDRSPETFCFDTAPTSSAGRVEFIAGSDVHTQSSEARLRRRAIHAAAAGFDPDFVLLAGDLWYDNYRSDAEGLVSDFFEDWHDRMIADGNRRIPLVPVEGNHDGEEQYFSQVVDPDSPLSNSPFYYNRLKLPGESRYYALQYGSNLSLVLLNSDHSAPMAGEQTVWLEQTLQEHQSNRWTVVASHLGAYPGAGTAYLGTRETWIRENWTPLFEQYGADLVINGHSHGYKQTYPILNNQTNEESGIRYIGDGGWSERLGNPPDPGNWFVQEGDSVYNFFRVTLLASESASALCTEPVLFPEDYPFSPSYDGTPFIVGQASTNQILDFASNSVGFCRLEQTVSEPVTNALVLPSQWIHGVTVDWASSAPDIVSTNGVVTRPPAGDPAGTAILTATISLGTQSVVRVFEVTVPSVDEGMPSVDSGFGGWNGSEFPSGSTTGLVTEASNSIKTGSYWTSLAVRQTGGVASAPTGLALRGGADGSGIATIYEIEDVRSDYAAYTNLWVRGGNLTLWSQYGESMVLSLLSGHIVADGMSINTGANSATLNLRDGLFEVARLVTARDATINLLAGGTGQFRIGSLDTDIGRNFYFNFETGNAGTVTFGQKTDGESAVGIWEWMVSNNRVQIDGVTSADVSDYTIIHDGLSTTIALAGVLSPSENYAGWVSSYGLYTNPAASAFGADPDDDGLNNLAEYALGGNPIDKADRGYVPAGAMIDDGETNWFEYVHVERLNKVQLGLDYRVEHLSDLLNSGWGSNGVVPVGNGVVDENYMVITNRILTENEARHFIRLRIEMTE